MCSATPPSTASLGTRNSGRWFHIWCLPSIWLFAVIAMQSFLWFNGVRGDPAKSPVGQWLTDVFRVQFHAPVVVLIQCVGGALVIAAIGLFQDVLHVPRGIVALYIAAPLVSFTCRGMLQGRLSSYATVVQLLMHFRICLYIAAGASCVVYLLLFIGRKLASVVKRTSERQPGEHGPPPSTCLWMVLSATMFGGMATGASAGSLANAPIIGGVWESIKVDQAIIAKCQQMDPNSPMQLVLGDGRELGSALLDGRCKIGIMNGLSTGAMIEKLNTTCEPHPFGKFAVAVIVNAKNPVRHMTFAEFADVFSGRAKDWSKLRDSVAKVPIELYAPSLTSTESAIVLRTAMRERLYAEQLRDAKAQPPREKMSTSEVISAVAKDAKAVAFIRLDPNQQLDKKVRVLAISKDNESKPVLPTADAIADGSYPLTDTLTIYLRPDAPPSAIEFCKFATGPEAAKIIAQFGVWPERGLEKVRGQQRLVEVKKGKGTEIVVCELAGYEDMLKDLSTEFVKAKTAVQLKFQKGETRDTAIEKLNKGATDLLLADGPLSAREQGTEGQGAANHKSPAEKGTVPGMQGEGQSPFPRSIELGRTAVAVIVHPENPLESLPIDEARSIFCGEVKKWPAVRGAAAAMHVSGLKHTDPTTQLLKEKLVERGRSLKYSTQPDNEKVILAVARDPAAIGFMDMSQLPPNEKSVKLVPVLLPGQSLAKQVPAKDTKEAKGKKAKNKARGGKKDVSEDVVANAKAEIPNPLSRTLTLYVSPNASQTAKDFADFLTPEHCKETIAQYNLLPPLHAENAKLASRPHPNPLPKREGINLASADEPIPLLLDDPDAPQDQAKIKKLAVKPKPVIPAPEQPVTPKPAPDTQPAPETESEPAPTQTHPGAPSLTDEQIVWLVGGIAGVVLLALGVGWLQAPHRKRKRR